MPPLLADITIHPADGSDSIEFETGEVDYISLVNDGTYGIPPLITKADGQNSAPVCGVHESVLYVNAGQIVAMLVERTG